MHQSETWNDESDTLDVKPGHRKAHEHADEEPTDWEFVQSLSVEEVRRAALEDPDAQPMPAAQLDRMRRLPNPREIRQQLGQMTQEQFARLFQIPVGTLRDWEQGVHVPDCTAKAFLRTIEADPIAVAKALNPTIALEELGQFMGLAVNSGRYATSRTR